MAEGCFLRVRITSSDNSHNSKNSNKNKNSVNRSSDHKDDLLALS